MNPRIFIFTTRDAHWITGTAMAEDGTCLAQHSLLALDRSTDASLTNGPHLDAYAAHYPGGYVLVVVENPANHAGLTAAYVLYEAANPS